VEDKLHQVPHIPTDLWGDLLFDLIMSLATDDESEETLADELEERVDEARDGEVADADDVKEAFLSD